MGALRVHGFRSATSVAYGYAEEIPSLCAMALATERRSTDGNPKPASRAEQMKLAIVAYPNLDEEDLQWIEGVRRVHDPQAARIGVHFTLVFPHDGSASDLEPEIEGVARMTNPIRFAIRHAKAVPDKLSRATHVFLVADAGAPEIAELHEELYAGRLQAHIRADIPFIPHITVGVKQDSESAERLASELGERPGVVTGTISALHLIEVGGARVRTVSTYPLGTVAEASR